MNASKAPSAIVSSLVKQVRIPRVFKVKQHYPRPTLVEVEKTLEERLAAAGVLEAVTPGMSLAVAVGSRGIAEQPRVVKKLLAELMARGARPFLFPAMGSHGGATGPGQREMLAEMGFTEASMGVPVRAGMEVVNMGQAENGLTCWFDAYAAAADGIIIVNRVKPHVAFRGRYESGLIKMLAIGLGKQKGADTCHHLGMGRMEENMLALGRRAIATGKILFGVALMENAYHELYRVEVLPADRIEAEEPALQEEAKSHEPRILFDELDVLVIDEIGKNISGTGFDTNIVGRCHTPFITCERPRITRIIALDLTSESHGNANGLGILDFTTYRAFNKISFDDTYPNSITSTVPLSVKIPMVLANDREAIQAAIKTCNILDETQVRLARIKNTLTSYLMEVSENLLDEVRANPAMEILSEPAGLVFNEEGNLF